MFIKREGRSRHERTTALDVERGLLKRDKHGDGKSLSKVFRNNSPPLRNCGHTVQQNRVRECGNSMQRAANVSISINTIRSAFKLLRKKYVKETH